MPSSRRRSSGISGLALCVLGLAAVGPLSAQSRDGDNSVKSPASAKPQAKSTTGAGPQDAIDLLKSRKLKRSGSSYVLDTETEVQRKLSAAKNQLARFRQMAAQQQSFESGIQDRKAFEQQLVQQRVYYNQQLAEVDRQMPSLDIARTNEAVNMARNNLVDEHNRLVALVNEASDRLRLLHSQGDESELKQKVAAEVARNREVYMQSILDLRELIDETRNSYDDLSKDSEITKALQAINETSKVKFKLGPSKEFMANATALEKAEAAVMTETVELRKQSGVYWVDVTFNGKVTRPMVFDTGAGISTLSSSLAAEIGLKPKPSDPTIKCQTADGSIVEAKQMTVGSMRVGKFTVRDVVCAVMPADKGDVDPLLGQSFHRHFTFQFTPESGRLKLSKVDEGDAPSRTAGTSRKSRSTSKGKRSSRQRAEENLELAPSTNP